MQDAYSLRCSPQVHGAARDTVDHAALVAGRELASAVDNPVVLEDGRVESNGNFHGAPVAYVLDFLAIVAADVASISRAPHRPVPGPGPQPRAAAVPGPRPGRRLRPHDRAVHPGRDRLRAQAAGQPGQRRLDPQQRDAGGPRLDGLVGGPQAAPLRRRAGPGDRHRVPHRGPRAGPARPARPRRRPPARRSPCCGATSRVPGRTGTSPPRSSTPSTTYAAAPWCALSRTRWENSHDTWTPRGARRRAAPS